MGGDVTVNSVPGKSSTFTIKVPAVVSEPQPEPATAGADTPDTQPVRLGADAMPRLGSCVLVIDDDPVQRDLLNRFLTGEGFIVHTSSNGEDGIRQARRLRPVAITLDVMMPGMDGWTVLATLKADPELHDIPVIMLTMMDDKNRGYALGAANYLTKPTNRGDLAKILKKYSCTNPPCPVLLVEDDALSRQMMRSTLEKAGWAVTEAENGAVALDRVAENRPTLIFLDLMMPEMDGFEFAAELHKRDEWRSIPIVVLTAKDLTPEERDRLNGNVHTVLDKGKCSQPELMRQVRDLIAGWAAPAALPTKRRTSATLSDLKVTRDAEDLISRR